VTRDLIEDLFPGLAEAVRVVDLLPLLPPPPVDVGG